MKAVRSDLDADEHDEKVKRGDLKEDTWILRDWCKCPNPERCRFVDGTCQTCSRRKSHHPETKAIRVLSRAMRGGMQVAPRELPLHTWLALGEIRSGQEM
jgi:hypothetical protein